MIELRRIKDDYQRSLGNQIIVQNHSYVPTVETVGRHIDYLVYDGGKLAGMIGIGSATYPPCKDILRYLGISMAEYRSLFNSVANNWKFCLRSSRRNLGSGVLKLLREHAPIDWYNLYGDELLYICTFVGSGHSGAVYKADNWLEIGTTAGLPEHQSVSMKWMGSEEIAKKFVVPTGENKKRIFITARLSKVAVFHKKNRRLF